MKSCIFICLLLCLAQFLVAQDKPQAFGKIAAIDFELSKGADLKADAVKLADQGSLYYIPSREENLPYTAMFERRVRIHIVNDAGRSYADVNIPVYTGNNNERMMKISAFTYNISGGKIRKTMVPKKSIYNRRLNQQWSQTTVVFPEVHAGSIIEYKYLVQRRSIADVKDWFFQAEIPTIYSEYQVRIPSKFHFTLHPLVTDSIEIKESSFTEPLLVKTSTVHTTGLQKSFIMRNLPAVPDEPFMGSRNDYLQRISCLLSEVELNNGALIAATSTWEEIVRDLQEDPGFGGQQNKVIPNTASLLETARKITNKVDRMVFLQGHIKKHFTWNGKTKIYCAAGLEETFRLKSGNNADVNFLLLRLLKDAGLDAKAILLSSRDNGMVNKMLPSVSQFNRVLVLVEEGSQVFILDATDAHGDHRLIPTEVLHTMGFVVEGTEGRWLEINDALHQFSLTTAISASIDSAQNFRGEMLLTATDYARSKMYRAWIDQDNTSLPGLNRAAMPGFQVSNRELTNETTDSLPLELKLNFSLQPAKSGDVIFFPLNFFPAFASNEFIATHRQSDIDFGYLQDHRVVGSFVIPADYIFEEVPPSISLIMPDSSIVFRRFTGTEGNVLNVRITVSFKRSYFTAAEYPEFSNFYKLLFAKLNEPVVLKKKFTP